MASRFGGRTDNGREMAEDCQMEKTAGRLWDALREHATHWVIGGVLIAATGFAPEEWLARTVEHLHVPENALHLWSSGIDVRVLPIGLGVAFIVGDVIRRKYREHPSTAGSSMEALPATLPLPDRPSIAVLPFANLSGDPEQEYFSDGVADDIITELSRDRALFVIARNSSFTYRGRSIDIKQVGRELGVRYVVEGSVRRDGDRALEHVFDVQDQIATAVASAISPVVGDQEQRRVLRKTPGNLSAWEEYQRGLWHMAQASVDATALARTCFRKAADLDPGFAAAYSALAFTNIIDSVFHGVLPWDKAGPLIEADARKAIELDPNDAEAYAALSHALVYSDSDAGRVYAERALTLNRNSAWAHASLAGLLTYGSGRYREGREEALISLRLNPRDRAGPMAASLIAATYYFERDYGMAHDAARRSLVEYPAYHPPRRILAAALGQLGRRAEAIVALAEFRQHAPRVFDAMVRVRPPYIRLQDQKHILEGLRKAGWQE